MATVNKRIAAITSHLPGVKGAVHAKGREIESRAETAFASHNRPGGHEIEGKKQDTDYLVSLVGPVPVVIEFGREAYTTQRGGKTVEVGPMQGLHILGKAAGL